MAWNAGFSKHFQSQSIIRAAGCCNALGAKLVERTGFDAVWISGLEVSASFALPDVGLLTMTELMDVARQIDAAISIPIIVDCDTGFGDELNVARLLHCAAASGVAAVCIEDKVFPKRNSFLQAEQKLIEPGLFRNKIRAAKRTAGDEVCLIARTETLVAGGNVDQALSRAECYVDAGADAILVHSKDRTPDRILDFLGKWQNAAPVVVIPTTYHDISAEELEREGASMVIYANHGLRSAVRAMGETLHAIRATGSSTAVEHKIASLTEIFRLQDTDDWLDLRK